MVPNGQVQQLHQQIDVDSTVSTDWYDVTGNSLYPGVVAEDNAWGRTIDNQVFQSGVFNVTLNNGSEWNTGPAATSLTITVTQYPVCSISIAAITF